MNAARQAAGSDATKRDASDAFSKENSSLPPDPSEDLLSALAGREADRDRTVAQHTRRVVLSSLGVMKEQKKDRSRARGVALAVTVVVLLLISPMAWEATESLIGGDRLGDPGSELSLWAFIVCPTLLAAALVAGWWKKRS